jgi:hypothetical protein
MLHCATVVLQYTNRGPTPRATARVALGVYPPLPWGLGRSVPPPTWPASPTTSALHRALRNTITGCVAEVCRRFRGPAGSSSCG